MFKGKVFIISLLSCLIIGTLIILQATKSTASSIYFPSQIVYAHNHSKQNSGATENYELKRIRVVGKVAKNSIEYKVTPKFELKFSVEDKENNQPEETREKIPVVFNAIKPDMFEAGRDVIIDGDYTQGQINATQVLTQCPSKYEPANPGYTK
jgi:cytochrome c-type biogenesis protein CcmE